MPNRLQKAIGVVKDQTSISLAKVNNSQPNLQVAILKATTHDDLPINEQYVQEILNIVSSNKIYAAECARAICRRIKRTCNWIVALKSLMLVLRIFQDGDPYFPKEILHATKRDSKKLLNLSNFCDHPSSNSWDYTDYVRTFGLYSEARLDCFLTGKLQRRYTYKKEGLNRSRKKTNNVVCDMKRPMLLDRIVHWQRLLDRAIATTPTGVAKQHQLVKISVYMVVKESFDLYKDISDGLAVLLLDNLSKLQHESRVSLFEICVKAERQFEELARFYSVCKKMGVGRFGEYPEVQIVSGELIGTPQEYLIHNKARYRGSFGEQTEFSRFSSSPTKTASYKCSESSLECKLLEGTNKSPSILIDMKSHSGQSKKRFHHQELILDLISFDDRTDNEAPKENKNKKV